MHVHLSWSRAHSWILSLNHQFKYVFWGIRNSGTKVTRKATLLKVFYLAEIVLTEGVKALYIQGKVTLEGTTELCSSTTVPTRVHMSYPHKHKLCIFIRKEMEETISFSSSDCAATCTWQMLWEFLLCRYCYSCWVQQRIWHTYLLSSRQTVTFQRTYYSNWHIS